MDNRLAEDRDVDVELLEFLPYLSCTRAWVYLRLRRLFGKREASTKLTRIKSE